MLLDISDLGKGAIFDTRRVYRYRLFREWPGGEGVCCFLMLNPSTADEMVLDPTVRRCVEFAKRWGYRRLEVLNLFAYRSTNPHDLLGVADPVGPENDLWIQSIAEEASCIVCAWGSHRFLGKRLTQRAAQVRALLAAQRLRCLKHNDDGQPIHPLYQPKHAQLIDLR